MRARGGHQDVTFRRAGRIGHIDLHQESVQLRFGQRIGAFLFNRVLRGQHMKRGAKGAVLACDGHLTFLHRLQKG